LALTLQILTPQVHNLRGNNGDGSFTAEDYCVAGFDIFGAVLFDGSKHIPA
jgi:hypothetical protein